MVLGLLAPFRCVVCSDVVRALPFCAGCAAEVASLALPADTVIPVPTGVARAVAAYRYTGAVARAVVAGKVLGATGVWRPLARDLAAAAVGADISGDLVVPVPTDRRRRRTRGVDHAAVLARGVAQALRLPLDRRLTVRTGLPDRGSQVGHDMPVPDGAVRALGGLHGRRVVLVDDVMTSGATASASASALLAAGADSICLAVLAWASMRPTRSSYNRYE